VLPQIRADIFVALLDGSLQQMTNAQIVLAMLARREEQEIAVARGRDQPDPAPEPDPQPRPPDFGLPPPRPDPPPLQGGCS
jgi:hypothetical protein